MSDPLSISASVAGLISLGIQVVGGVTKYLDAVRERKNDVALVKAQVVRMQDLLKLVAKVAAKAEPNHSTIAAFLRDSASVQPELQALDEFIRKIDTAKLPHPSHEVLEKVYVQAKKLTYPFHRPTMDRLQSQLARVNAMLQAALQVSGLDVAIDIERTTSAIKTTLPDLHQQVSEQIKQEHLASRDAAARVRDSVMSLSGSFDQGLAKVLEDIATTNTVSVSNLNEHHAEKHAELLQEVSMTQNRVSDLNDTVKGVDTGIVELQDIATMSTTSVALLRQEYAETHARALEELAMNRRGISDLGANFKRFDLALRALPTREELGRLISKPGQLKELCDIMKGTPGLTTPQYSDYPSRISLSRRTCVCRKRVTKSRQALLWGPWQVLTDASTTHDHFPDCICHSQGAAESSKRWSIAFKGMKGLLNRAIEVSFLYSFGAGGGSLSPGFKYYPTIDRRRDPAFRVMGLFSWASNRVNESEPRLGEFLEQCLENIAFLYRCGKASPRAVDLYGRGIMHYLDSDSFSVWRMNQCSLLTGLDTLVKHGVQTTSYDIYGSTPAWNMIHLSVGPWFWDGIEDDILGGPGLPSNWDKYSLLSNFLCAPEPCEPIVAKSVLELSPYVDEVMELSGMMRRSPATAEAFGCGPLSLAALEGDLKKMESLLKNYPNAINELNLLKQTPLHLAVGHPSCVALLFRESGGKLIDLKDSVGRRAVEYSLFSCIHGPSAGENQYHDGCLKNHGDTSLNILLNAGCMIPKVELLPRDRYTFTGFLCDNCLLAVSSHLVDRREGLKRLAAKELPRMQATALGLLSHSLPDSNATRVVQALNQCGVPVQPSLQVHGPEGESGYNEWTSAYHDFGGPLPFSLLWSLGFHDVDTPDIDGNTPLLSWCKRFELCMPRVDDADAGRCSWLIENGADLWKMTPDGNSTIGHELYSRIGHNPPRREDSEDIPRRHIFDLTEKLSHLDQHDRCRCACSPGGCTPFVRYLQAAFRSRKITSASELIEWLPKVMMETHTSVTRVQMRSAVRFATFEMLGIRHTCCHSWPYLCSQGGQQNEELYELRQEDGFLVTILDDLVAEFEVKLEQILRELFVNKRVSFWHGDWLPRMQQVLESINSAEIEESDKVAAEEIGVMWHEQESGKGKDCDEDFDTYSDSYGESVDCGYHESDWDSEIDEYGMIDTLETMEDWTSRLNLIMSKAGLSAGW